MNEPHTQTVEQDLGHLSRKVNDLIALCDKLKRENKALREQQHSLSEERAVLMEKNELARSRVEAMISRLKTMETIG